MREFCQGKVYHLLNLSRKAVNLSLPKCFAYRVMLGLLRGRHLLRDDATLVVRDAASDLAKVLSMIGS